MVVVDDTLSGNPLNLITDPAAKSIVDQALPKVHAILTQERNRLADALLYGTPFLASAAVMASATYYLVPEKKRTWKVVGYGGAALILGGSAVITLLNLKTQEAAAQAAAQGSTNLDPYIESASQSLIAQADPRVRQIIQEERARLASALEAGLPWALGASMAALASIFLIPDSMFFLKFLGWTGATALSTMGARASLEGMKSL